MPQPVLGAIQQWMFEKALPWWTEHGVDRGRGGFVEQASAEGDVGVHFKRTRVTARQIYVFSHAYELGWAPGAEIVRHGLDYLYSRTWIGSESGFARKLTREGKLADPTVDLYDHAFVMFALAWAYRATNDATARDWLYRTTDFVETYLRHPSGKGFVAELPEAGWRQQNPHMHLTEAALAAYEATGDSRFALLAKETSGLFRDYFFNKGGQVLSEFFTASLDPAPGDPGHFTEPGHQFEWTWILGQCMRLIGVDFACEMRAASAFAERHGVDPDQHVTFNSVRDDGTPLDRGSRTWPNTERLKSAVALYELDGADPMPVIETSGALLLDRYLSRQPEGTWIDAFDANGAPLSDTIPASTLYHVFLAFAEVRRIGRLL